MVWSNTWFDLSHHDRVSHWRHCRSCIVADGKREIMAKFVGTVQEFHHFIGPRVRNAVNGAARGHRDRLVGICEGCGGKAELQSAHVHGRDRRTLIESVLAEYTDEVGMVACDLAVVESRIIESHLPIDETFKFLCHPCHLAYDSGTRTRGLTRGHPTSGRTPTEDDEFRKLSKIKRWASRPHQINHQIIRAFLLLEQDGEVELARLKQYCTKELHMADFQGNYASMKTDAGNAHGKVFLDDGTTVRIWPRAREEIDLHF